MFSKKLERTRASHHGRWQHAMHVVTRAITQTRKAVRACAIWPSYEMPNKNKVGICFGRFASSCNPAHLVWKVKTWHRQDEAAIHWWDRYWYLQLKFHQSPFVEKWPEILLSHLLRECSYSVLRIFQPRIPQRMDLGRCKCDARDPMTVECIWHNRLLLEIFPDDTREDALIALPNGQQI